MFVVEAANGDELLLWDRACEDLQLVKRVYQVNKENVALLMVGDNATDIVKWFPNIFEGQGTLPFTYKLQLNNDSITVMHAAWHVPAALLEGFWGKNWIVWHSWELCNKLNNLQIG